MKALPLYFAILLAASVPDAASAQEPGDVCQAAWKQSSASKSCTSVMQKLENGRCGGKTQCLPKNYPLYPSGISLEDTKKLVNCDGELKLDEADCPSSSKYSTHTYAEVMSGYKPTTYSTHDPTCQAAWDASSAKKTCVTVEFIQRSAAGDCTIQAQCAYGQGHVERDMNNVVQTGPGSFALGSQPPRRSTVTVSTADAKKLSNCDGYLKTGACD
ncbi:hypothetical protein J5226_01715 [Lysobacter sp. K5869]|uniref:hypothetical protein n=1 Tax=Lysobacter sp. K5869 TaxID=2820808 RepID=UPI001C063CD8|nr:hypothetical protein [Lysobacter sp. K5869]QWP77148.1 hypothetical protein J5226_01715 [Lysobacter sp. K5869]